MKVRKVRTDVHCSLTTALVYAWEHVDSCIYSELRFGHVEGDKKRELC